MIIPSKAQYSSAKSTRTFLTKSSKLTKKQGQQEIKRYAPYFQADPIRNEIMARVKKDQGEIQKQNHLEKAEGLLSDLMNRHKKAKQKLQKMKQESEKDYEKLHPFTPTRECNTQRYSIKGDVIRRNQIWLRERKKKILQLKEEVTLSNLKECTFSPSLKSKKQSQIYLRNRSASRSLTPRSKKKYDSRIGLNSPRNQSGKRDFTEVQYETAKRNLISRMMTVAYEK